MLELLATNKTPFMMLHKIPSLLHHLPPSPHLEFVLVNHTQSNPKMCVQHQPVSAEKPQRLFNLYYIQHMWVTYVLHVPYIGWSNSRTSNSSILWNDLTIGIVSEMVCVLKTTNHQSQPTEIRLLGFVCERKTDAEG